jgi:peptide/nickel transport system permease protein
MFQFIAKRIFCAILVLLGASFITYAMMFLAPGNASLEVAIARYGDQSLVDQNTIDWITQKEGLDQPFWGQYTRWLKHILVLDFGNSLVEQMPVFKLIQTRFGRTLTLSLTAIGISLCISLPIGILAGLRKGTWMDSLGIGIAVTGVSMPNHWLGLALIVVFCVKLQWLPSFGRGDWMHLVLPAVTLGTALTAYTTRILRSTVIDALQAEHLQALRARGVGSVSVLSQHVAKNCLIPVVTIVGLEFGMILEGTVITETIFAWPGLGDLMVKAVSNRDYPLIQGMVLFTAIIFVSINLLVDLVSGYIDPRIRM